VLGFGVWGLLVKEVRKIVKFSVILKKTAYIDNNIVVDIEQEYLSRENLLKNVDTGITDFFYSSAHLQEANEMTAKTEEELNIRLKKRFTAISSITYDNYIETKLDSHDVYLIKKKPSEIYEKIDFSLIGVSAMKGFMSIISEIQKQHFRSQIGIDPKRINNYNPKEIIDHINSKSDLMGGYSFIGFIDKALELHPLGAEMGRRNVFTAMFEFLDLVGYWKDGFTDKSNYARLWDSNHAYYSSQCDYFISDDKRTRNKTKVVFEYYDIHTKIVSSKGTE
tara:strand:- start:80408 stop:81244 length:837 start_codon:yes stop_codon:yes gene_type:complete